MYYENPFYQEQPGMVRSNSSSSESFSHKSPKSYSQQQTNSTDESQFGVTNQDHDKYDNCDFDVFQNQPNPDSYFNYEGNYDSYSQPAYQNSIFKDDSRQGVNIQEEINSFLDSSKQDSSSLSDQQSQHQHPQYFQQDNNNQVQAFDLASFYNSLEERGSAEYHRKQSNSKKIKKNNYNSNQNTHSTFEEQFSSQYPTQEFNQNLLYSQKSSPKARCNQVEQNDLQYLSEDSSSHFDTSNSCSSYNESVKKELKNAQKNYKSQVSRLFARYMGGRNDILDDVKAYIQQELHGKLSKGKAKVVSQDDVNRVFQAAESDSECLKATKRETRRLMNYFLNNKELFNKLIDNSEVKSIEAKDWYKQKRSTTIRKSFMGTKKPSMKQN